MALIHKFNTNEGIAVGGNKVWNIAIKKAGNTSYDPVVPMVIESISPSMASRKVELQNGEGDTYGIYYTDKRRSVNVSGYILGTSPVDAHAKSFRSVGSGQNKFTAVLIEPGDEIEFRLPSRDGGDAWDFLQTGVRWLVDSVGETREFGERRMLTFSVTSYDALT